MKTLMILLAANLGPLSVAAYAHSDHHHQEHKLVTEIEVKKSAKTQVERLIENKKLDSSWKQATLDAAEKKDFNKQTEWVVSFSNKAEKDQSKLRLYVFFSLSGEFLAANHTGK